MQGIFNKLYSPGLSEVWPLMNIIFSEYNYMN